MFSLFEFFFLFCWSSYSKCYTNIEIAFLMVNHGRVVQYRYMYCISQMCVLITESSECGVWIQMRVVVFISLARLIIASRHQGVEMVPVRVEVVVVLVKFSVTAAWGGIHRYIHVLLLNCGRQSVLLSVTVQTELWMKCLQKYIFVYYCIKSPMCW